MRKSAQLCLYLKSLLVYFIIFLTLFSSALYLSIAIFGDHSLQLVKGQTEGEDTDSVHNETQALISKTSLQQFRVILVWHCKSIPDSDQIISGRHWKVDVSSV